MDASEGTHRNLIATIWLTSFMIASPLLHTYDVEMAKRGSLIYSNDIHDIVVYMGNVGLFLRDMRAHSVEKQNHSAMLILD